MQPNDCSSPILPENGKFLLQRPSPPLRPSSHPFPRTVEVIPSKKKNKKKNTSEMFLENLVSWGVKELKMTMLEVHQENKPEQKWQDLLWVESFQPTFQSPFLNRTSLLRLAKHLKKPSSIKRQRKKVKSLSCVRFFVTPWTVAY